MIDSVHIPKSANQLQNYIGTKQIKAKLMNLGESLYLRKKTPEDGQDVKEVGYHVEYADGYTSWSPAKAFEDAYRVSGAMTLGLATEALRLGLRVARTGWLDRGTWLYLVPGSTFVVNRAPLKGIYPSGTEVDYAPHIDMRAPDGRLTIWTPSQIDLLAEDYYIVKNDPRDA